MTRLYDKSDAYNDLWNKKIHIKLNILDDSFVSRLVTMELSTWHHHMACWPKLDGLLRAIPTWPPWPAWPRGLPVMYHVFFFRKKVIQFFPKAYIFNGGIWKNSIQFLRFTVRWKMPSGKSICIVSVQSTPISKSLQVFLFQRMVSCASSTSW